MENEIERIQLFTDNSGEVFRDQVGKYMKHKYGIAWADKYLGNVSLWKNQEEKADEFTEEEEKQNDQLKDLFRRTGSRTSGRGKSDAACSRIENVHQS